MDENIFLEIHWPQLCAIRTTNLLPKGNTDAGDLHRLNFCGKKSPILLSSYFQRNRSFDELLNHNTPKDLSTISVSIALFSVRQQIFVLEFWLLKHANEFLFFGLTLNLFVFNLFFRFFQLNQPFSRFVSPFINAFFYV